MLRIARELLNKTRRRTRLPMSRIKAAGGIKEQVQALVPKPEDLRSEILRTHVAGVS